MAQSWKTIRVFISSTFRDMQAERDHLVRFVFPRLREQLLRRRMRLVDIDLRWGVTADQDAFDLCMDEIDRCQPRFVCLLGERYGWVPPPRTISEEFVNRLVSGTTRAGVITGDQLDSLQAMYTLDREGGVYRLNEKPRQSAEAETWHARGEAVVEILQRAELPDARLSITASEIHYAALDRLDQPVFRYFYFRDPSVTESIPHSYAAQYRETAGSHQETALHALKQRIKNSRGFVQIGPRPNRDEPPPVDERPLAVFEYGCRWDKGMSHLVDFRGFGDRVYKDLLASIDAEYGSAAPDDVDEFARERDAIGALVETHTERYVTDSRQPVFAALKDHADGGVGNSCFCIVGDAGSGKSALLAKFYRDYSEGTQGQPDAPIVIAHFVGASAASTSIRQILYRLCHELSVGAGIVWDIPDNYDKLRETFAGRLESAAAGHRVVLMIDAINQLDLAYDAQEMNWLPGVLPDNVRIILTSLPGRAMETLRARETPPREVVLEPLDANDESAIIEGFLGRYRKTLDVDQRSLLIAKQEAGTPLYLLTALEELRTLGTYEAITERIRELPGDTQSLFVWILKRLEKDQIFRDEQGRLVGEDLVPRYCSYIAVGRSGMAQAELVDLIAPGDAQTNYAADSSGNVAALQRLLRPHLLHRGELVDFSHAQLREAVRTLYLPDEAHLAEAHKEVALYLQSRGYIYTRTLSELIYHFIEARCDDDLIELMDGDFPDAKLGRLLSVAEVAHDYALALDACERRGDLIHGVKFCLRRSRMSVQAESLVDARVAWLIGRLASADGDLDYARRVEALAREFTVETETLIRFLCGVASGLAPCPDRDRLLFNVSGKVSELSLSESGERSGHSWRAPAALDFVTACLDGENVPADLVNRACDLAFTGARARLRAAGLRACKLWRDGDRNAADALLASACGDWKELASELREETLATAVEVWHRLHSLEAAAELIESSVGTTWPSEYHKMADEIFVSLLRAARAGRFDWLLMMASRMKHSGLGPVYGTWALLEVARNADADRLRQILRLLRFSETVSSSPIYLIDVARRLFGRVFGAKVSERAWAPELGVIRGAEWQAYGLALAHFNLDSRMLPRNLQARVSYALAKADRTNEPASPLHDSFLSLFESNDSLWARKEYVDLVGAAIERGASKSARRFLDRLSDSVFGQIQMHFVKWGNPANTGLGVVYLILGTVIVGFGLVGRMPGETGTFLVYLLRSLILLYGSVFVGTGYSFVSPALRTSRQRAIKRLFARGKRFSAEESRRMAFHRLNGISAEAPDRCFMELREFILDLQRERGWLKSEIAAAREIIGIPSRILKTIYHIVFAPFGLLLTAVGFSLLVLVGVISIAVPSALALYVKYYALHKLKQQIKEIKQSLPKSNYAPDHRNNGPRDPGQAVGVDPSPSLDQSLQEIQRLVGTGQFVKARETIERMPGPFEDVFGMKNELLKQIADVEQDYERKSAESSTILQTLELAGLNRDQIEAIARENNVNLDSAFHLHAFLQALREQMPDELKRVVDSRLAEVERLRSYSEDSEKRTAEEKASYTAKWFRNLVVVAWNVFLLWNSEMTARALGLPSPQVRWLLLWVAGIVCAYGVCSVINGAIVGPALFRRLTGIRRADNRLGYVHAGGYDVGMWSPLLAQLGLFGIYFYTARISPDPIAFARTGWRFVVGLIALAVLIHAVLCSLAFLRAPRRAGGSVN